MGAPEVYEGSPVCPSPDRYSHHLLNSIHGGHPKPIIRPSSFNDLLTTLTSKTSLKTTLLFDDEDLYYSLKGLDTDGINVERETIKTPDISGGQISKALSAIPH